MGILQKMAWSKSTRIKVMIALDTAFFFLELITGFLAHSLALMADAFHMLNDIISLIIGLWAVSAAQKATTDEFTFGWVRAEILGAFFNAVFLIALCVSIVLEALTRFIEPPEIDNPKMMLIVGSAGLFSNLLGFVVLGGHGHSHGHSHDDHDHDEHAHDEEEGGVDHSHESPADEALRIRFDEQQQRHRREGSSAAGSRLSALSRSRDRRHSSRSGHSRLASFEDMSIHPASFRQEIIAASMPATAESPSDSDTDMDASFNAGDAEANEESPLLQGVKKGSSPLGTHKRPAHSHSRPAFGRPRRDSSIHDGHNHTLPRKSKKGGHGHDHGDMGMNAMILHVIGDALGNIGVMVTALIIWLTDWPGKLYADPAVSLFITAIILNTSIPLTLATARVLLQATPEHINIQDIRQDIEALPCVITCHHIHVWQLSDTKLVASMHIQVSFPIDSQGGEKYMQLARRARKCLHAYGIHSATIQPEFCLDQEHLHEEEAAALTLDGGADGTKGGVCLLECVDDCRGKSCCTNLEASSRGSSTRRASESSVDAADPDGQSHNHDH
ncbi:cation efflux protein [Mariannaea sp. PMI_226]|nr:cation efflux protein [Mariannaea sp. PMI_226]